MVLEGHAMPGTMTKAELHFERPTTAIALTPLVLLPIIAVLLAGSTPPWQRMWMLSIALYFGFKWFTFAVLPQSRPVPALCAIAYLFLWPGMNAKAFCDLRTRADSPTFQEWTFALFKLSIGTTLIYLVAPRWLSTDPLAAGWIGMIGLALALHFGLFHLLSIGWRSFEIDAEPIMHFPILATSLSDFWGRRWNLAFRDLAFGHLFRPFAKLFGVAAATMAVFIASGVVHDLVISWPVRAGYGGPTIYFALQGAGLLLERSRLGQSLRLGDGFRGRMFCGFMVVAPLRLLFHDAFIRDAILPTLAAFSVG